MFDLIRRNGVAVLTLSRPPVNAISNDWLSSFHELLDRLAGDDDWSILHIRSDQKVFCAGADLEEMRGRFALPDGIEVTATYVRAIQVLYERIEALPQVTLAEIGGAAMGGGLELALACDLRMAAREAKLGLPEGRLGLLPGAGGTQRLTRLCGPGTASRIILGCEIVDGAAAEQLGIVQWAVPRDRLAEDAQELAERIAELPSAALAASKNCIAIAPDPARDGYAAEIDASRALFQTDETRARVTAFLEGGSGRK